MLDSQVLVVEDDPDLLAAISDTLEVSGHQVQRAADVSSAIAAWSLQQPDVVISDMNLGQQSGREFLRYVRRQNTKTPFVFMTAYGTVESAVAAMQEGANEFIQKPFKPTQLLELMGRYHTEASDQQAPIIDDPKSQKLFQLAEKIAQTDSTVLLSGPSGSGKEVMANFIHQQSKRAEFPFVAINCAAIPENMLEATLFGYEKGAFTGAVQAMPGKFEQANHGTLLLDEVSEMDLGLQAKLLRVLQEQEVERLGSRKSISLNVRVIATTNRDLKDYVTQQKFREDLYFRLNVFPLRCLSLKERSGDILPLCHRLLTKYAQQNGVATPVLTPEASSKLLSYSWPGNVRELDNMMQRCLIISHGGEISVDDLMFESDVDEGEITVDTQEDDTSSLGKGVRDHEYQIIIETLKQCNGRKKLVAETLGISPRTLRYKMARMRELGYQIPA